jgi:hypothetical protein
MFVACCASDLSGCPFLSPLCTATCGSSGVRVAGRVDAERLVLIAGFISPGVHPSFSCAREQVGRVAAIEAGVDLRLGER